MSICISNCPKSHCNASSNESFKSLKEIAEHYINNFREEINNEIEKIKIASLQSVLNIYGWGKNIDNKYIHLSRLRKDSLKKAEKKLLKSENEFRESKNFDEIFNAIQNKIEKEINGIGKMYTYDTALAIGRKLNKLPEFIYLHKGTRKGAKLLKITLKRGIKYISKDIEGMPTEFRVFEPYEIEDILCIYKKDIENIATQN